MDPRVEFISQFTNLKHTTISESLLSINFKISIVTKSKVKIFTKPSLKIFTFDLVEMLILKLMLNGDSEIVICSRLVNCDLVI